jgi:lysophospholipase L1-like esterase
MTWVTCWAAAANGVAGPSPAQPDLDRAFAGAPPFRARRQSFRMVLRPSLPGTVYRFRLANRYGDAPLQVAGATLALHQAAGALVPGSVRRARFAGRDSVTIAPGEAAWSDGVALPQGGAGNLAVSFYIEAADGALTWHADAFTTSYITAQHAGDCTAEESERAFAYATSSWVLVDALDVEAEKAAAIVALGDSITDGWITTMNGHDRWTDVLARRLAAAWPGRFAVVNQGLCGNRVSGDDPMNPSALARFERDVTGLSRVGAVILFVGTNDLGCGLPPERIVAAMQAVAAKARAAGLGIIAATILPRGEAALPSDPVAARAHIAAQRRVNDFIREGGAFDGVVDFAAVLADPADPDRLDEAFIPNAGGPGDGLHPNRLAHLRLGEAVPLGLFEGVSGYTVSGSGFPFVSGRKGAATNPRM